MRDWNLDGLDWFIENNTLYWTVWEPLTKEEKKVRLNSALLFLKYAYPCLDEEVFDDEHVALQAAFMSGSDYQTALSGISRVSAATSGIAVSWRVGRRGQGLSPMLFSLFGDPMVTCPEKSHGTKLKVGRGI
jgi:hypothetical protein